MNLKTSGNKNYLPADSFLKLKIVWNNLTTGGIKPHRFKGNIKICLFLNLCKTSF